MSEPQTVVSAGGPCRDVLLNWKMSTSYVRACALGIKNHLKGHQLINPQIYLYYGRVDHEMPAMIPSSHAGCGLFTKTMLITFGCSGVVSYDIEGTPNRLVTMFHVPLIQTIQDNFHNCHILPRGPTKRTLFNSLFELDSRKAKDGKMIREEHDFIIESEMDPDPICSLFVELKQVHQTSNL